MSASFASVATGGYVPPLAATTAAQVAATATAAVAATMTGGRASVATGYVPPLATGSQTAGSTATFSYAAPITWSTNSPIDTDSFLYYFVEPYLDAHQLSRPSWRYAYILWFLIGGVFIGWSLAHQFGERGKVIIGGKGEGGDGVWAATWRKWSVRRINFKDVKKIDGGQGKRATIAPGKKRRLPSWSGPTVAQVITVLALLAWTFVMAYLGPDYLNPTTCTFGGTCPVAVDQGPPKSTFASSSRLLVRRSERQGLPALPRSSFPRLALSALSKRQGVSSDKTLNPDGWAPFNDPLLAGPNYDVYKSWWTSSNRLGLIGFALLPLVVTLALKYWPFNIFATPFLTNYGFDKTAMLHRWIGRIVWLFSTLHVATWSVQLFLDKDPYGKSVWFDVWLYYKFIGGVVAYAILTLLIFLSFNTFRSRYYEFFHFSHMVLSLIFLVGCIVHYPPLATWAIIALALWGAERAYRLAALAWINGIGMKIVSPDVAKRNLSRGHFRVLSIEKVPGTHIVGQDVQYNNLQPNDMSEVDLSKAEQEDFPDYDGYPAHSYSSRLNARRAQRATVFAYGQGQDLLYPQSLSDGRRPHSPSAVMLNAQQPSEQNLTAGSMNDTDAPAMARKESSAASTMINLPRSIEARQDATIVPPPGYALVQLLPGRTMRLTIRTPRTVKWRPGQHILLTVPSVRLFESHPYTIANADERDPDLGGGHMLQGGDVGSTIYLIVRARKGFTRALWQKVVKERRETESPKQQSGADEVEHGNGVMIRACVGLPMGSSARANWHSWRTLVIVCGGAGVSFGIALLDYICRAMATRDADRQANERRDSKRTSRGDGKPSAKQRESPVKTTRVRFVWILKEYAHLAWIAPTLRRCMELVPPEQLRVDLFVSSARGIIPAAQHRPSPLNDDHVGLLPPTPGFARKQAGSSRESLDTTMSEDEDSDNEGPRRSGAAATSPQRPNAPPEHELWRVLP